MAETISATTPNQRPSETGNYTRIANGKIDFATVGLLPFIYKDLTQNVSSENALNIAEYILVMKTETNLSDMYRTTIIQTLSILSRFSRNKSFTHMTRDEILAYLDSIRKPDMLDPLHKWIGTYNLKRTNAKKERAISVQAYRFMDTGRRSFIFKILSKQKR